MLNLFECRVLIIIDKMTDVAKSNIVFPLLNSWGGWGGGGGVVCVEKGLWRKEECQSKFQCILTKQIESQKKVDRILKKGKMVQILIFYI